LHARAFCLIELEQSCQNPNGRLYTRPQEINALESGIAEQIKYIKTLIQDMEHDEMDKAMLFTVVIDFRTVGVIISLTISAFSLILRYIVHGTLDTHELREGSISFLNIVYNQTQRIHIASMICRNQ